MQALHTQIQTNLIHKDQWTRYLESKKVPASVVKLTPADAFWNFQSQWYKTEAELQNKLLSLVPAASTADSVVFLLNNHSFEPAKIQEDHRQIEKLLEEANQYLDAIPESDEWTKTIAKNLRERIENLHIILKEKSQNA